MKRKPDPDDSIVPCETIEELLLKFEQHRLNRMKVAPIKGPRS